MAFVLIVFLPKVHHNILAEYCIFSGQLLRNLLGFLLVIWRLYSMNNNRNINKWHFKGKCHLYFLEQCFLPLCNVLDIIFKKI